MTTLTPGDGSPASDLCQRWRDGGHSWRHRGEGGFDRRQYDFGEVDELDAKEFVEAHHYSSSYPASSRRYGLFDRAGLVGVAVLSIPVQAKVLTNVFPDLVPYDEALELGRFVLLDQCPGNAESFFLGQVFRAAGKDGIRGVVSFSDPMPRRRADGTMVMPGHVGTIYQASSAKYLGRGTARSLTLLPDGTSFNGRAMQKVRKQERGHEHVERKLVALGARPLRAGERPVSWLAEALDTVGARRVRHRGNHRYAFPVGPPLKRRHLRIVGTPHPYPKSIDLEAAAA